MICVPENGPLVNNSLSTWAGRSLLPRLPVVFFFGERSSPSGRVVLRRPMAPPGNVPGGGGGGGGAPGRLTPGRTPPGPPAGRAPIGAPGRTPGPEGRLPIGGRAPAGALEPEGRVPIGAPGRERPGPAAGRPAGDG